MADESIIMEEPVAKAVDQSPPGFFHDLASKVGTTFWVFLMWLSTNPNATATLIADAAQQDWGKLATDLEADWKSSHP